MIRFNYEATGLGSVPFKDPKIACQIIFDNFPKIPFWPQLPKRSYLENMYVQFSERLPGLVVDESKKSIYIDTTKVAQDIEEVYAKYLDGDVEFFRISEDYAKGFYEFLSSFTAPAKKIRYIKGQITGPVSFALSLTDQNKRPILYDKDLFEILTKVLCMRARWQIKKLKEKYGSVIIFIDEPYLVSIGSTYININVEEAVKKLDEIIAAIKKEGALAGIHCCGNTDWPVLLKRDIDILSFDAYNFTKELLLYGSDIKNYLKNGGTLAWGVVPSSDAIDVETKSSIIERLKYGIKSLTDKGIDKNTISSMITPSCGLGTLDEDRTKKILELLKVLPGAL